MDDETKQLIREMHDDIRFLANHVRNMVKQQQETLRMNARMAEEAARMRDRY
jgi:hypothetical protein